MSVFITKAFGVALLPLLHLASFDHDVVVVTFAVHFDLSESKDLRFHGASGCSNTINHARDVTQPRPISTDLTTLRILKLGGGGFVAVVSIRLAKGGFIAVVSIVLPMGHQEAGKTLLSLENCFYRFVH